MTALVCAFFTSFTGASGVTILALGGVLMPVLLAARYTERSALGLLTGAGSLGMLFPPCLPLIIYAIVANHSAQANLAIKQMFLGGIGPGILLVILTAWWGIRQGPKERFRPADLQLVGGRLLCGCQMGNAHPGCRHRFSLHRADHCRSRGSDGRMHCS